MGLFRVIHALDYSTIILVLKNISVQLSNPNDYLHDSVCTFLPKVKKVIESILSEIIERESVETPDPDIDAQKYHLVCGDRPGR